MAEGFDRGGEISAALREMILGGLGDYATAQVRIAF